MPAIREYLYQHDVGLSRLRRMMQKAAKEQLAALEEQQGVAWMNGLLNGKRIVVTGAARGLGYHFAEACAGQGAAVVMCDILRGELAESAHRLQEKGYRIESHGIDLADSESVDRVFSAIGERGAIDGLVNNAAMATRVGGKNMLDYDPDLWDRVMTVNVKGTWLVTRAAVPLAARRGGDRQRRLGYCPVGAPRLMAYVASKGAVIAMTRSMARELGESASA
ncbi:3-ketoacyl-ACP reductase [Klebsiella michiganensis]|nr:3-ketoacyl-ACP reductase [Klebsiella michiganensis]